MKVGNKSQKMACLSKDFVAKMEDLSKELISKMACLSKNFVTKMEYISGRKITKMAF